MAQENLVHPLKSLPISGTFASKIFTFVKIDTNGQLATPSSGAGDVIGVIQNNNSVQGQDGTFCSPGDITKVQCGGSFSKGNTVMTDGSGKAVVCTSGSFILGIALEAGANNTVAAILFQPRGSKL